MQVYDAEQHSKVDYEDEEKEGFFKSFKEYEGSSCRWAYLAITTTPIE